MDYCTRNKLQSVKREENVKGADRNIEGKNDACAVFFISVVPHHSDLVIILCSYIRSHVWSTEL